MTPLLCEVRCSPRRRGLGTVARARSPHRMTESSVHTAGRCQTGRVGNHRDRVQRASHDGERVGAKGRSSIPPGGKAVGERPQLRLTRVARSIAPKSALRPHTRRKIGVVYARGSSSVEGPVSARDPQHRLPRRISRQQRQLSPDSEPCAPIWGRCSGRPSCRRSGRSRAIPRPGRPKELTSKSFPRETPQQEKR